MIIDLYFILFS